MTPRQLRTLATRVERAASAIEHVLTWAEVAKLAREQILAEAASLLNQAQAMRRAADRAEKEAQP